MGSWVERLSRHSKVPGSNMAVLAQGETEKGKRCFNGAAHFFGLSLIKEGATEKEL